MRTLVIGKIWPEPASSAAGTRTLDLLRSLRSASWEISFACAAQSSDYSAPLDVPTHAIQLNDSSFDRWIAELNPEAVIFDRYMTEEQYGWRVEQALPNAIRILDTSDLHCLREARQTQLKSGGELELNTPTARREIASILRCDLTLMISEFELQLLKERFCIPDYLLAYWPFSLPEPADDAPSFSERKDFVMIGSFLHEPNWDAVRFCRESIWPLIRKKLPDAELHVYGSYVPEKALQLQNEAIRFHIRGRAKNAVDTLKSYRVNLAPLRFGAGLKGKLADAFLAGTPSVATPIATEGMCGNWDWGSEISDDPVTFAATACALYQSENAWTKARDCGAEIARNRFAESAWLPLLPQFLDTTRRDRDRNRNRNFYGSLLRHHQYRSSEYMSRWIEEKNRK